LLPDCLRVFGIGTAPPLGAPAWLFSRTGTGPPPETEHDPGVASATAECFAGALTHPVSSGGSEQVGTVVLFFFTPPLPSRVTAGARFRFPPWRPGRAARTTGVLSWMALFLLGKTDRSGGGVSFRGRERERIELHLGMTEEPAERLCVRLKRQVKVGDLSGGVGHRPG